MTSNDFEPGRSIKQFRNLLFFSGSFNIILALPLAFPFLYEKYFILLTNINTYLNLGGEEILPPRDGIPALLINTAGIDLVLIGVVVFYTGFNPLKNLFIPLANAIGRILFAFVIVYYVLFYDIARLVLIIAGIDLAISIGFFYFLFKLKKIKSV